MRHDTNVWDILHDGSIVGLEGAVPGVVRVTVDIEYLRELLADPGHLFVVRLTGCDLLECRETVGDAVSVLTDLTAIAAMEPEILGATERNNRVVIALSKGSATYLELHLQYAELTISVDSGRVVPLSELRDVAQRYWANLGRQR